MTEPSTRPRVGVVLRTKNRPYFLRRAIRDILAQEYDDWQTVIVNDGGDERDVQAALATVADTHRHRFTVLDARPALGRSGAANAGIRAVDCEYVVLHDDDDLWDPRFLRSTVEWLEQHPEDAGVMVRTEIIYERAEGDGFVESGRAPYWPGMTDISYSDLLQVNRAVPISFLYRAALHSAVGPYREDLHAVEDWEFYLRVTLGAHVAFLDGPPLAFWMQRVGVGGDLGNSMFALATEHDRYDRLVRDEALRSFVREWGPGLPLYLARYIQDEVGRQLDERAGLGVRLWRRARALRHRGRTR
ncbi:MULTISPECIES: glycosyltransferase family A protein [unclassified Microbacterium]|uniref:glycosyltransferase family 2 protein n=1 Tax=unclassified Microbacterium TaxID=2609290 RepID=UPI00214C4D67|nr:MULTISPECIES: glycosyltransferase family A protein [unclassified Microbacterium]MCR2785221.1 glycosyltransferase family 2 protein [Microbacterium sp. zg.B96]MDL5352583.1 glycosyltransferase family A protein [Microbacterium sp. zg-YB36]WIM16753.1 glycosyltransferase family A protein [Microbacterium sp. zg-B96]